MGELLGASGGAKFSGRYDRLTNDQRISFNELYEKAEDSDSLRKVIEEEVVDLFEGENRISRTIATDFDLRRIGTTDDQQIDMLDLAFDFETITSSELVNWSLNVKDPCNGRPSRVFICGIQFLTEATAVGPEKNYPKWS